jgi:transcription initiation factor TFIIB
MYRLRRWQRRTRISSSSDRNLSQAFDKINRIASQLGLPKSIREKATVIYRRAAKKGLVRGRSIDGVATAAIYIACRLLGFSRTLHELKKASGISKTTIIARDCKFLKQKLNLHLPAASPDEYVPRIGSNLGLSGEAQCKAAELIRKMRERGTASGRSPVTVAAAAVYIASLQADEPQTEREVAKAASVSEISVRTGKNEICRKISIKIPKIAGRR